MKIHHLLALTPLLPISAMAGSLPIDNSARLSIGANVGYVASAYDTDNKVSILPQAFYDNNRLYLEGAEGGVYVYKDAQHQVRIGLTYDGRSFDPDDAKNDALKQLDERKTSVQAHASYMRITPIGGIKIKATTDISGRHDGSTLSLSHLSKFTHGKATLYPAFGLTWHSEDYNQYYYGVSVNEAQRSGIAAYQAKDGISPFVSATLNYDLTDKITLFGNQRVEWLSSSQKDSPMTDGSINSTTRLGLTYNF
ncbi:MAG: MipA/OmpV family protein [Moraxella sp.]|nr:MipA/OmpV family protein [Moraxella sp.]